MPRRTGSSQRWRQRQERDIYVERANRAGWRSRAVFKLEQIQAKERLLKAGTVCVDLGSAPGSWSQLAARLVGPTGRVVAVDLLPMEPIAGVQFLQADFTAPQTLGALRELIGATPVDLVMSDMAPNISGNRVMDQPRSLALLDEALLFAANHEVQSIAPVFLVLAVVMIVRRAGEYAFVRPGREMLQGVLSPEAKYKAKNFNDTVVYRGGDAVSGWVKNGIDATAVEGMREPYPLPMRLTVHHPKQNVPVLWWRSVGSTHTAFVMETLIDEIARASKIDPVAYRLQLIGDKHPRHRAALQLAVDKSGYGKKQLASGRAWGVALHESFESVVAYVVEASVREGRPTLHRVTAGVHCNLAVNPLSVEAQVQGAALMGLATCLPGAAITLKDGVVEQSNFGDYMVPRMPDMPRIAVHIVPSAEPPTGMGEPGLPPLAPAFANAIGKLTGKTPRELPFKMA